MRKNEALPEQTNSPDELWVNHHHFLLDLERRGIKIDLAPWQRNTDLFKDSGQGQPRM